MSFYYYPNVYSRQGLERLHERRRSFRTMSAEELDGAQMACFEGLPHCEGLSPSPLPPFSPFPLLPGSST